MTSFVISGISADQLESMRTNGRDALGNAWQQRRAAGWEPLRCCLQLAEPGAAIALISYSPSPTVSVWAEVGPVFVHADDCLGWVERADLPKHLQSRHQVLRTYRADGAIHYDRIRVLQPEDDLAAELESVLTDPGVAWVDIRSAQAQCWSCAARRA